MRRLAALGRFLLDFVVGDDWITALGVVVAIGLTALLAHAGVAAWWVLPAAVCGLLGLSLWRLTKSGQPPTG